MNGNLLGESLTSIHRKSECQRNFKMSVLFIFLLLTFRCMCYMQ